jgi:hypothetical protein
MTATKKTTPHVMPLGRFKSLLVVAVVAGLTACGQDDGPFAPVALQESVNDATITINGVQLLKATAATTQGLQRSSYVVFGNAKSLTTTEAKATIGRRGGVISVTSGSLSIPKRALNSDTTITMVDEGAIDGGIRSYVFGPSGLLFNRSATLTIKMSAEELKSMGIDPYRLGVAYVTSPEHSDWQVLGGVWDPTTETISVPIDHFSRYALCIE